MAYSIELEGRTIFLAAKAETAVGDYIVYEWNDGIFIPEDDEDWEYDDDEDEDEEEYDEEDFDDDEDCYATTCPTCEEEIFFDESILEEGEVICPNCGEKLEFDLSSLEEETVEME